MERDKMSQNEGCRKKRCDGILISCPAKGLERRNNATMYYPTRIELHDAKWEDYETLHAAMGRAGFSRLIRGSDGKTYHLPWAEYVMTGDYTAASVRDAAVRAAATTGKSAEVLTSASNDLAWQGLKLAA
jgi:hypothetical protein